MDYFNYRDNGQLFVEECAVAELAAEYGTPLYVYSRATLERHWNAFDRAAGIRALCVAVLGLMLSTFARTNDQVIVLLAVALVVMTFIRQRFARQAFAMRAVLLVAGLFGAIDALKATGISVSALDFLPLFSQGLAWLLPTLLTMVFCACLPARDDEACCAVQES